mgnify:CR=1 FL=1
MIQDAMNRAEAGTEEVITSAPSFQRMTDPQMAEVKFVTMMIHGEIGQIYGTL